MASNLNTRVYSPIRIKQTTLHKYFDTLPCYPINNSYVQDREHKLTKSSQNQYTYSIEPDNHIEIEQTHCLTCQTRLLKNGFNKRFVILDQNHGECTFFLHRKRCPNCGEIPFQIDQFAPKYGTYHENFKRRTRQLFMEGLIPSQIQRTFHIFYELWIPKSTIVTWINSITHELNQVLNHNIVPSSGYWAYDEIFLRINGKKVFLLVFLDIITNFVIKTKVVSHLNRGTGLEFIREAKRDKKLSIKTIIKDGGMMFGNLFSKCPYKKIKVQLCKVHLKWLMNRYIRKSVGMSVQSRKPLPEKCLPIRDQFYRIIDTTHETNKFAAIEALRITTNRLENKHLTRGFQRLEAQLPRLLNHLRDPNIPLTNNKLENKNQYLERNPSLKYHMKSFVGAQRVVNYRTFKNNLSNLLHNKIRLNHKYQRWRMMLKETPHTEGTCGQGRHFQAEFKKLERIKEIYLAFWQRYIAILGFGTKKRMLIPITNIR
ncbi:hypothetical protein [Candidatus Lokiarchaeum ossiferum]|uniref:hypothetical protein n=1 Tax=Candidatus Lokiarchaeum ossiferum TaxID=2951803 RepID=UPI00352EC869